VKPISEPLIPYHVMSVNDAHTDGTYKVELRPEPSQGFRGFRAEFSRINVILGANGTGKSRLIQALRSANSAFAGYRRVLFIEGGRVLRPHAVVGLTRETIDEFRNVERANEQYRTSQHQKNLTERIARTFILLARKGEEGRVRHSDSITAWLGSGRESAIPEREEPPLDRLFRLFHEIFPEIQLALKDEGGTIRCQKDGFEYLPNNLSDGERQVLSLLADVALLAEPNSLVLVDEPELNLHPNLACRLWDSLEANLPDGVFVYATHSLGFAMRSNVDRLFVLSGGGRRPIMVPNISAIPAEELREFLGAIPAILAASATLVVEGQESSVDSLFYRWLLGRPDLVIVPVGGSENVSAAVRRTGVWERLAPSVRVVGVVDRDYRSNAVLEDLSATGVVPLQLHEVESYLCWPQLCADLSSALALVERPVTAVEIEESIFSFVEENALKIAVRRTHARASLNLGVSIPKSELRKNMGKEDLRAALRIATETELAKVEAVLGASATDKMFDEEVERVRDVLQQRSLVNALAIAPGKDLLGTLLSKSGCRSPDQFIRATSKHLIGTDYPPLRELRDTILAKLDAASPVESSLLAFELPIDDWPDLDPADLAP
jgi:energy-coupling factor transporter ATP-binding protein EcfA2